VDCLTKNGETAGPSITYRPPAFLGLVWPNPCCLSLEGRKDERTPEDDVRGSIEHDPLLTLPGLRTCFPLVSRRGLASLGLCGELRVCGRTLTLGTLTLCTKGVLHRRRARGKCAVDVAWGFGMWTRGLTVTSRCRRLVWLPCIFTSPPPPLA
jgi:hypothetical protein